MQYKIEEIVRDLSNIELLIQGADGQVADNKETNVEELDKKINEEKDKIVALIGKLNSEILVSKATTCKDALDDLKRIKKKFDESIKKLG